MLALGCGFAFAQDGASAKLKEVQQGNMWVPDAIKVDGRLDEWIGFMRAFNTATKIYYAIANDDKNLYVVMLSTDGLNNTKVMTGGITLSINTDGKKKTENAYNITYPVLARQAPEQRGGGPRGGARPASGADMLAAALQSAADTATISARNQTLASSKEVRIAGFKDIADSLISIYNDRGVKVSAHFDSDGNYTYEIAIPLTLIGVSPAKEFAYNIKINEPVQSRGDDSSFQRGGNTAGAGFGGGGGGARGGRRGGGGAGGPGGPGGGAPVFQEMISPTDFWGKYTLAKK